VSSPALLVEGITKAFGNHVAVDDISFEVPRGVVYGILGPNGAGKSTTLRMINDIIAPDSGKITILDGMTPGGAAAQRIGYLPEERGLYPKMKVAEIIEFMGELRGLTRADARKRGGAWLERLGLAEWTKNKVQDLSKGMQQKVQFAAALIHEPDIVILDEPWSGLDPINADVLRTTVDEIRDAGRTVLFSTHQMEQAEKVVDAVCIIARGKKILDGNLREIKRTYESAGWIALAWGEPGKSAEVLATKTLIAETRAPLGPDADAEVRLAAGATSDQLLRELLQASVALRKFEVLSPSLHQIFVEKVGAEAAVAHRTEAA